MQFGNEMKDFVHALNTTAETVSKARYFGARARHLSADDPYESDELRDYDRQWEASPWNPVNWGKAGSPMPAAAPAPAPQRYQTGGVVMPDVNFDRIPDPTDPRDADYTPVPYDPNNPAAFVAEFNRLHGRLPSRQGGYSRPGDIDRWDPGSEVLDPAKPFGAKPKGVVPAAPPATPPAGPPAERTAPVHRFEVPPPQGDVMDTGTPGLPAAASSPGYSIPPLGNPPSAQGPGPGPAPTPPTGGVVPTGSRPRLPLGDQRRTEAFDDRYDTAGPELQRWREQNQGVVPTGAGAGIAIQKTGAQEGDTQGWLGQALDGVGRFIGQQFHLDGQGAVVGQDPREKRGMAIVASGMGATPPATVARIDAALDKAAGRQLSDALHSIGRMEAAYRFYMRKGNTKMADNMAYELYQYTLMAAARYGDAALQALQSGNIPGAREYLAKAYNQIPSGNEATINKATGAAQVRDARTGELRREMPLPPEVIFQLGTGFAAKSLPWRIIAERAERAASRGESKRTPDQEELTRSQIELNRARTQQIKAKAAAGVPGVPQSVQDRIDAGSSPGARPPGAPPLPAPAAGNQGASLRPESIDDGEPAGPQVAAGGGGPAAQQVAGVEQGDTSAVAPGMPSPPTSEPPGETQLAQATSPAPAGTQPSTGPVNPFDITKHDYDVQGAEKLGYQRGSGAQMPIFDQSSGMVLMGHTHPQYMDIRRKYAAEGYLFQERADGREYLVSKADPELRSPAAQRVLTADGELYERKEPTPVGPALADEKTDPLSAEERAAMQNAADQLAWFKAQPPKAPGVKQGVSVWTERYNEWKRYETQQINARGAENRRRQKEADDQTKANRQTVLDERKRLADEQKALHAKYPHNREVSTFEQDAQSAVAEYTGGSPGGVGMPDTTQVNALNDGTVTAAQLRQLVNSIGQTNNVSGRGAVDLYLALTKGGDVHNPRFYEIVGRDTLGNIIVRNPPTYDPVTKQTTRGLPGQFHLEPETFKTIENIAARRTAAQIAKEAEPSGYEKVKTQAQKLVRGFGERYLGTEPHATKQARRPLPPVPRPKVEQAVPQE